ncbi:MAG: NAD-dependent epimerase/dehydratase family protein [Hyphomonadaceae bacterium]
MLLLTGAAGFIGFHMARRLAGAGWDVVGVDEVNAYYNPAVKRARLAALAQLPRFRFVETDIAAEGALEAAAPAASVTHILHLAAQAGVRYSLQAPFSYEHANVRGHLAVLEHARAAPNLQQLIYASSSSVYGDRADGPFRESDRCDRPASLYAATKRAGELMSETYAHLYGVPAIGLRFFTAYGPWGRPDMALWMFTDAIMKDEPITLYGEGLLARDFTYIDDITPTIEKMLRAQRPGHEIYNLGNSEPHAVNDLVAAIEKALGKKARTVLAPRNPVEVTATFADISCAKAAFGFAPSTKLESGVARFVEWRRAHPTF